jgi:allantoate deiminase
MAIDAERIRRDIEAIARCTETPGAGATRPTFSPAWGAARAYVIAQAGAAGAEIRVDAMGNLHARPNGLGWQTAAWLCGSHLDSVPHGGDYDGVAGVVVALELLRSAHEDKAAHFPFELIVFAEEEGPTFGLGILGARAWVGELGEAQLQKLRNSSGQSYLEAGRLFGVDGKRIEADRLQPAQYLGLIEAHIEQGPGLWRRDQRLAVVRAIAGRRQYRVCVEGEANHAGAASMKDRRDALAGVAQIMCELEAVAHRLSDQTVITVGRLTNYPNAVNVIPDRVEFTIDFRVDDDPKLSAGEAEIRKLIGDICAKRGLRFELEETESLSARPLNPTLCEWLVRAAHLSGAGEPVSAVSGALHDSAVMAPHLPTAMLFVPSKDGVSHNPAEFSRMEDLAVAAGVIQGLVRRPTLTQLNAMEQAKFVGVCGSFFEHSPWVAEQAWAQRPFATRAELSVSMCRAVGAAPVDRQLALIRAHPDLVGKLAREGRLTSESTSEQAGAGLTDLSETEAAAFERYNAAYHDKFGFPFVICVREHRKEAILTAFPIRLENSREQEMAVALLEIYKIANLRLLDAIWEG